jgi:hypothetical protein
MFDPRKRHTGFTLLAFCLALGAWGCEDDPVVEDPEPEVATMRLVIGSQTINVDAGTGAVTGGPIAIGSGNTAVSVQWIKEDGTPETIVTAADFELLVEPANTAIVTFSRTGAFTGNLVGGANGSTTITFGLFHLEEGHEEFEWPVPVTKS